MVAIVRGKPRAVGGAASGGPRLPPELETLVREARAVRSRAYAPYSRYHVGAALRAADGRLFLGVNVENSAYPTGQCAERTAIGAAVTAGARAFSAVAVATELGSDGRPGSPCGQCRQALLELGGPELVVLLAGPEGEPEAHRLGDLLPLAFTAAKL